MADSENETAGAIWQGFQSKPYDLAAVRADNEAWAIRFRPLLMKRDEEKRIAREAAKQLAVEQSAALAWCRENGSPHLLPTKQDNPHDQ